MRIDVVPKIDEVAEQALRTALAEATGERRPAPSAWRTAALREAVERGGYAFSPRRTRGATRA